ncbi:RNA methyltransferase [Ichthyenterobacterium sp. W332]|uniref:tRNA (guanosine(18)-2'-O)-methyltransferase n=1 Tax=Microcosmobacter mediterraneus TaxID=3075607 RepID=A0ABU2YM46_9FLAO|nr:RNA methyltransferase [Ichthyenterobacterium sp. W332]MDT0559201.1 RNA methyltransferase [Ichthyenterobacterium sp. W332]
MTDLQLLEYLKGYLTEHRKERFEQVLAKRTKHFTVATEDVYQLHNTSAVIRSCDVFGVQDIHVVEEINSKRIDREIAMGAQKWVDVYRYNSISECLDNIKAQGYQIIATTPHKEDCLLQDFDISKKSCFFFGRETEGLSDEVIERADRFIKIPMSGFTESLNISVSAAIILQHVTSQLRASDIRWQLTEELKQEKWLDWIKKTIKSYDKITARFYESQ